MAESNEIRACNKLSVINATFYAFIDAQMLIRVAINIKLTFMSFIEKEY